MLVLFETAAGYAVFKLLDEKKLKKTENLYLDFETAERANQLLKMKHFKKFQDTTEALAAATAAVEGKMSKPLKKLMKKVIASDAQEELAVSDSKLGNVIKEKFNISCVSNSAIHELMRGIRSQMDSLITGLPQKEMAAMALGLAHSLSRYKLKFSPDKVDTMIVQAISLLDDLDKELNNYIMRTREWYGWHFPELTKIIGDNLAYAKSVKKMGYRTNAVNTDLSDILPEDIELEVKQAAEISMGTEISEEDILNITYLCDQVIEITEYRQQLYEYVKNRMMAVAPNLTVLVGELVGARLIAHAGSLLNLAKHPSSTVQILGAEKALFRALKTKHDTPKYGLIYHASLVGQANQKLKGKMEPEDQKHIHVSNVDEVSSLPDGDPELSNTCVKDPDTTAVLNCDESREDSSKICSVNLRNLKFRGHQHLDVKAEKKRPASFPSTENINMDDLILRHITEEMDSKSSLFSRLLQQCDEISTETAKVLEDLTQKINSHYDSYIKALEIHRSRLIQQLCDHSAKQTNYIESQKSVLSKLQQTVNEVKELLNTIITNSLDESSHWKKLSKLLLNVRRANVHVRSQEMTFCPDADGPAIDQYQFYGRIVTGRVCQAKCFINQEGLEAARVRHKSTVPLHVVQEDGKPYPCDIAVVVKVLEPSGSNCKPKEILNNMDGTWSIEIVPREIGKHELYVTVDGKPIKTKCVVFHVKHSWREHTGRWHCCSVCSRSDGNNEACIYGFSFEDHSYCHHLAAAHPGAEHWTCCGKVTRHSECDVTHRNKRLGLFGTRSYSRPRPLSSCSVDLRRIHSTIKEVTL